MTDVLYRTNFFNSAEMMSYINECTEIIFEVQYPSSNFSNIYPKLTSLRQSIYPKLTYFSQDHSSKIKIGIFYTPQGQKYKNINFYNNKEINYVRFDSNIKGTPIDDNYNYNGSFENCTSLIEIFVPSFQNKIGNCSFKGCSSLKKILSFLLL